ncbi:MAG: hypothetical protein K0R67_2845 [Paenibacillus sp.]|jgi:hypothetical protein|nr:hypothetical protein [Paenibacillus sp.]
MTTNSQDTVWQGEIIRAAIPRTRDPFINTSLLALGPGDDGEERFWISSWNSNSGSTGVIVTESGKERIYRFPPLYGGFYSAAQEDEDTLWLCGNLSKVVKLTLSNGEIEEFETGAPSALVFQGMALDRQHGKLFASAYPMPTTASFSFDFRNRVPSKVYMSLTKELYMCSSFENGDGTYTIVSYNPQISLLHWNPLDDKVEKVTLEESVAGTLPPLKNSEGISRLIRNDEGLWYFPGKGWYNPLNRSLTKDGPRPEQEMTWFARIGDQAWGAAAHNSDVRIGLWDMQDNRVKDLCIIPDGFAGSVHLTTSAKIVAVNLYGNFYRYDGITGELEMTKVLPTDSLAEVDCLLRIDKDRLLGTPFITQAFWELNLATGVGVDLGRAAPGPGEILETWKFGDKVYMAAYVGGELVEYDPGKPAKFPINPRVVAAPPGGQRPVAAAQIGEVLYYSNSHKYGNLGCIVTKYDTSSGTPLYKDDPIPGQMIRSLCYDIGTRSLLAGTTMHADVNSCTPNSDLCYFARLDEHDMSVVRTAAAPLGTTLAAVHGAVTSGSYLCTVRGTFNDEAATYWFVMAADSLEVPELQQMGRVPKNMKRLLSTGQPGLFLLQIEDRFELWNMQTEQRVQVLYQDSTVYRCLVQDDSVYLLKPEEVVILENCLSRDL